MNLKTPLIPFQKAESGESTETQRGRILLVICREKDLISLAQKRGREALRTAFNSYAASRKSLSIRDAEELLITSLTTNGSGTGSPTRYFQFLLMEATTGRIRRGILWRTTSSQRSQE